MTKRNTKTEPVAPASPVATPARRVRSAHSTRTRKSEMEAAAPTAEITTPSAVVIPVETPNVAPKRALSRKSALPGPEAASSAGEFKNDHQAIAQLAYSYWEARGCQGGSPELDWFHAEQALRIQATNRAKG